MFKDNLKLYRKRRNMTQDELVHKLDTKKAIVARYESGQSEPNIHMLIKLSQALNVSIDVLVGNYVDVNVDELVNVRLAEIIDEIETKYCK